LRGDDFLHDVLEFRDVNKCTIGITLVIFRECVQCNSVNGIEKTRLFCRQIIDMYHITYIYR